MLIDIDRASSEFALLADSSRLKLLLIIISEAGNYDSQEQPPLSLNTISGLASQSGLSQATITHHVKRLEKASFITKKRRGRYVYLFPEAKAFSYLSSVINILETQQSDTSFAHERVPSKKQIELTEFNELIDYIGLHGFTLSGPATMKNAPDSLRYHLQKGASRPILLTYSLQEGSIYIGAKQRKELRQEMGKLEELIRKALQL